MTVTSDVRHRVELGMPVATDAKKLLAEVDMLNNLIAKGQQYDQEATVARVIRVLQDEHSRLVSLGTHGIITPGIQWAIKLLEKEKPGGTND